MVPTGSAVRNRRIQELLTRRSIGQGQIESASSLQGQFKILAMQFDAKTGFKVAPDHPLSVYLQYLRRCKAAHERLAHLSGVCSGLRGEQKCLADGFYGQRNDDLVGNLGRLAVSIVPYQVHVLAHHLKQRAHSVKDLGRSTHHDGQRGRLCSGLSA
jgi:hypothetical protein